MKKLVLLTGVGLAAMSAPALAQATQGASPAQTAEDSAPGGDPQRTAVPVDTGNDIVVEARRRDESVQDVPLVVNAVSAEKIAQLNLRDFREIQTVVPGLTLNSNANGIGTTSSVRGVNFDVNASGNNGTIEYYLNDTPLSSNALFNAMYDIGQIEVLRGPQGTLRGRASPSGSITIAHRKPNLEQFGGYALGTANSIGGANLNGALNVPILPGVLALRVSGLVEGNQGNRVRSINNPSVDPYAHTKSGRAFLRFEPADFFAAEAVYQRIELKTRQFDQVASFSLFQPTAAASPVLITPDERLGRQATPRSSRSAFDIFTWKASAGAAGQRLYYVGGHLKQRVDTFVPLDDAYISPTLPFGQFTTLDAKGTTHEVRLQNEERVFGLFDYAVGYFNSKQDTPSSLLVGRLGGTVAAPVPAYSATLRLSNTKEESYFGNLSLHLGDSTEISGGLRHIRIDQRSSLGSVTVPGGVVVPPFVASDVRAQVGSGTINNIAAGSVNRTFEKTIYSASVKHRFSDSLMVYGNFGTSFRPGNNVVRALVNNRASSLETSFLVLPSETSKSYEVGVKSDFFDKKLTINVAAFQQDYKNYPLRSPSGIFYLQYDTPATAAPGRVNLFNFVSPVPVRVRGVEFEADLKVSDRLNVSGNFAYALGKIRNGQVACLDLNGDGVPDTVSVAPSAAQLFAQVGANNLSTCPVNFRSMTASPINANVQAEYTMPVNDSINAFSRGLLTLTGRSQNDPANAFDNYDETGRLNLYFGVRDADGAWEIAVFGKNITANKTVIATGNGPAFTTVGATTVSSSYINLGTPTAPGLYAPREFGLTARYAFGSR